MAETTTTPFSLLIKPADADCNLKCPYCFYLDRASLYPDSHLHRMSDEVLEKLISTYMQTDQPAYTFAWQGGEPTLMGSRFFRKAVELQAGYAKKGSVITNGLQTNATLIDEEMASILGEYKFLTGVSMDGPEEIHNHYRKDKNGRGSFSSVMQSIKHLRKYNVEFNILTLVTDANVLKAKQVYNYLRDNGFYYHQYIPCVEFDPDGNPLPFCITGAGWGRFLCDIFDEWVHKNDSRKISVRIFDSILNYMVRGTYPACNIDNNCSQYFVVEHNGDVYPCDFFVEKNRKLGNIFDTSWHTLQNSQKYTGFGIMKSLCNDKCSECEYLKYCNGGCLKHRFYKGPNPRTLSWLCEGLKMFFSHTIGEFKKLAADIIQDRQKNHKQMFCHSGPCFHRDKLRRESRKKDLVSRHYGRNDM